MTPGSDERWREAVPPFPVPSHPHEKDVRAGLAYNKGSQTTVFAGVFPAQFCEIRTENFHGASPVYNRGL